MPNQDTRKRTPQFVVAIQTTNAREFRTCNSRPARLQGVHGAVGVSGSAVGEGRGADGLDARRLRAAGTRVYRTADGQGPITPWNIVSATVLKQLSNIHNKCT